MLVLPTPKRKKRSSYITCVQIMASLVSVEIPIDLCINLQLLLVNKIPFYNNYFCYVNLPLFVVHIYAFASVLKVLNHFRAQNFAIHFSSHPECLMGNNNKGMMKLVFKSYRYSKICDKTVILINSVAYSCRITALLRNYAKIEAQNCQLITQHGRKKFKELCGIAITKDDNIVVVDKSNNNEQGFETTENIWSRRYPEQSCRCCCRPQYISS